LSAHEALDESEKKAIAVAIETFGLLIPYVQKIRSSKPEKDVAAQKRGELHMIIINLRKLQGRLESQTFEV
jgi:hypothetical protein